jgi:putative thioredoxin
MNNSHSSQSQWVLDTSQDTFQQDVIERSNQVPVIVDFWAPWCGPCRMLSPILEKLTEEAAGRFVLVKANTEEVPNAAMSFRVQSIPAVFAVIKGQVVDGFVGLMPEGELKTWLDRVADVGDLQRAQALETNDPDQAKSIYRRLHEAEPQRAEPRIGLARIALAQENVEEATRWIDELEARGFLEPEAQKLKASLELQSKKYVDVGAIEQAAANAPNDWQLQLQLAEALAAQQRYGEALETLLKIVEQDRKGLGEQARALMVDIFRILPDDSELTSSYRRKLSAALY